ncbi:hypothetical protein [Parafilimonas sp.]|uniref:hypothetical protein n=1 Tax=Parafilimonas sp. TaxID=1969739 RepID=UPI0039E69AF1
MAGIDLSQAGYILNPNARAEYRDALNTSVATMRQDRLKKKEQAKQDEADKWKDYYADTDFSKYQTPSEKANDVLNQRIADVKAEAREKITQMPREEFKAWIYQQTEPIGLVDNAIRARIEQQEEALKIMQQGDKDGTFDYLKLHDDVGNNVVKDFFTENVDGTYSIKPQFAWGNSSMVTNMLNPDNPAAGNYVKSFDFLNNWLYNTVDAKHGGQKVQGTMQTDRAGQKIYKKYSGYISPFMKVAGDIDPQTGFVNGTGDIPQLVPDVESIPGTPLITLPDDKFDKYVGSNAMRLFGLRTLWARRRPQGIKPDSAEDNLLFRDFVARYIVSNDKSQIAPEVKETNSAPLTRIQLGLPAIGGLTTGGASGTKTGAAPEINDVYGEIETKMKNERKRGNNGLPLINLSATAQKTMVDTANKIAEKNINNNGTAVPFSNADIAIYDDGNQLYLARAENGKFLLGTNHKPQIIAPLTYTDVNSAVNTSQKQKQEIIKRGNKPANTQQDSDDDFNQYKRK